jgi:hypothetical protein
MAMGRCDVCEKERESGIHTFSNRWRSRFNICRECRAALVVKFCNEEFKGQRMAGKIKLRMGRGGMRLALDNRENKL